MKRSLVLLALAWALAACDKEETVTIPDSLAGTEWQTTKGDDGYISLTFDAKTYEMVQYTPYYGEEEVPDDPDEEQPSEPRTYRYAQPRVELREGSETVFSGEIMTDGKSRLLMVLQNTDKSETMSFFNVKK